MMTGLMNRGGFTAILISTSSSPRAASLAKRLLRVRLSLLVERSGMLATFSVRSVAIHLIAARLLWRKMGTRGV
jgi:hypothetical protein